MPAPTNEGEHTRPLRVALVSPFWSAETGSGRCAIELADVLRSCPITDLVVDHQTFRRRSDTSAVFRKLKHAVRVYIALRHERPDVVIVNTTVQASTVLAARAARTPIIWWCHESGLGLSGPVMRARLMIYRRFATTTVCVSGASADHVPDGIVIPNIVEAPPHNACPVGAPPLLLVLGTKSFVKGTDRLTRIVSPQSPKDARLCVIGNEDARNGPLLERVRRELEDSWGERLEWSDATANPDDLYRRASVLLLPSRADTRPRVVEEALAHGVPVVATRLPGLQAIEKNVTVQDALTLTAGSDWGQAVAKALRLGRSQRPYIKLVSREEFARHWLTTIEGVISGRTSARD